MTAPKMPVTLSVNGLTATVYVEPRRLLSDVLRHDLGLTGTHVGCEHGVCGACTVWWDNQPVRSCLAFAVQAEGHEITTIEGLNRSDGGLTPLQSSFQRHHALQCGFCTPGMLLTAEALIRDGKAGDAGAVREALSGNLCRCTGYQGIVEAVLETAGSKEGGTR